MERRSTAWTSVLYVVCFGASVWLAMRTITPAEAQLWDHLIRPSFRTAFFDPISWSSWIYAVFAKRTIGLFRLSELTLRMPALLAGASYLALLPRRPVFVFAAAVPVALGVFSMANGLALGLAFCAAAWHWRQWAPVLLGAAIATAPLLVLPLATLAVRRGLGFVERVAIPAIVTAFILVIVPLSHAEWSRPAEIGSREVESTRDTLITWRDSPARIGATAEYLPVVRYYKDRYRQREWTVTDLVDSTRPGVVVFNQ